MFWCSELTSRLEDIRITVAVARGEGLHHTVDLLGFTGQPETPQELPAHTHTHTHLHVMDSFGCERLLLGGERGCRLQLCCSLTQIARKGCRSYVRQEQPEQLPVFSRATEGELRTFCSLQEQTQAWSFWFFTNKPFHSGYAASTVPSNSWTGSQHLFTSCLNADEQD